MCAKVVFLRLKYSVYLTGRKTNMIAGFTHFLIGECIRGIGRVFGFR